MMNNDSKTLFKIPIINKWYIIITLIFILMRYLNIIDWSPLWILSPLWLPIIIALFIIFVIYLLKLIIWIFDLFKI